MQNDVVDVVAAAAAAVKEDENVFQILQNWLHYRGYALYKTEECLHFEKLQIWKKENDFLIVLCKLFSSIQVKIFEKILIILKQQQQHNYSISKIVILYESNISSSVKTKLQAHNDIFKQTFEFICTKNLIIDIIKHRYQPKFTLLTKSQTEKCQQLYENNMPLISINDPVVKIFDWRLNSVICICSEKCNNNLNDNGFCCVHARHRHVTFLD